LFIDHRRASGSLWVFVVAVVVVVVVVVVVDAPLSLYVGIGARNSH